MRGQKMSKDKKQAAATLDAKAIKEMEKARRAPVVETVAKVDFDFWWASRKDQIKQPQHMKEILAADARGRGLSKKETMESWDNAVRAFGLKF